MSTVPLQSIRELLEQRFPGTVPVVHRTGTAVGTGIEALDRALPGGGLPRSRMVVWRPGGGATAVLRMTCQEVVAKGERAAWVDGLGVATGDGWETGAALFRPHGPRRALECAEELVRTGGFGLVVLSGVKGEDAERVRLTRAVREGGGVLVLVDRGGFMAGVRLMTRLDPEGYRWRRDVFGDPAELESVRVKARVTAMGWSREAEFSLWVASHDVRMSLEPALVDRRGVAR